VQTFTTVGYGGMIPSGFPANFVASIEAMIGLLGFAIATGLLYGRFSRLLQEFFSAEMLSLPHIVIKLLLCSVS